MDYDAAIDLSTPTATTIALPQVSFFLLRLLLNFVSPARYEKSLWAIRRGRRVKLAESS